MSDKSSFRYTYNYDNDISSHSKLDKSLISVIEGLGVKSVLDIGCGNGNFAKQLSARGYDVVACDPEDSAIRIAQTEESKVSFHTLGVYDDFAKLDVADFDLVIATEVVEHLFLPRKLIDFSGHFLKPGGLLVISIPYYGSYIKNLICSLLDKWDEQFTVFWDGGHIKFWSLKTLRRLLEDGQFELLEYQMVSRHS